MKRMEKHDFACSFLLLHLLLFGSTSVAINTTDFSLELIHIDNVDSPFYNPNLTNQERYQRLQDISDRRLQSLESATINGTFAPLQITQKVVTQLFLHLVVVGIGTPPIKYHLELDTGSDTVWTQCEPCEQCYDQKFPIFDPRRSSTFRRVPCTDPLCRPPHYSCVGGEYCTYTSRYADGITTAGTLSRDTLVARSGSTGSTAGTVPDFVFGCSTKTTGLHYENSAGILGMGFGATSLASQVSGGSFSYCLSSNEKKSSFLRFGSDIKRPSGMAWTSLIRTDHSSEYHLNLIDIGIDGNRLNLPPRTFERQAAAGGGGGGCVIDSGSTTTYLIRPAYEHVRRDMEDHFRQKGFKVATDRIRSMMRMDLCYVQKRGLHWRFGDKIKDIPSMEFHFSQRATLTIVAKNLFVFDSELKAFCLAIKPSNGKTVIGSIHQRDVRFIYNVNQRILEFGPDDCSSD